MTLTNLFTYFLATFKESFKLSTVSRKESDEKMFEANEVLKEIESLKDE